MERDQAIKLMQDLLRRDGRRRRLRPVHHRRLPARHQGRRRDPPAERRAADRRAGRHAGARHHERPADARSSTPPRNATSRSRRRASAASASAPSCSRAARAACCALINAKIPELRGAGPAADPEGSGACPSAACASWWAAPAPANRPRSRRWSATATRTPRGHIVTIEDPLEYVHPAQGLRHHPPRGRRGYRFLARRAQEHPAPGAGRDPHRRDPRPRDHGVRHPVRRDRPPGARDAARQQRQPGARPHRQLLPGRAPRSSC